MNDPHSRYLAKLIYACQIDSIGLSESIALKQLK